MSMYATCAVITMHCIRIVQKMNMLLGFHGTMEGLLLEVIENVSTLDDNGSFSRCSSLKNLWQVRVLTEQPSLLLL